MSISLMKLVWTQPLVSTDKLLLLRLCDYAGDDGSRVFPSVARLAHETSLSERHVQRRLRSLEKAGYISVVRNARGGCRGMTRNYLINVVTLSTGDTLSPITQRGDTSVVAGVTSYAATGDTSVTQTINEPSKEPLTVLPVEEKEPVDESLRDCLQAAGLSSAQIRRFFTNVRFEPGMKALIFPNRAMRDHVERRLETRLCMALGYHPTLEVAANNLPERGDGPSTIQADWWGVCSKITCPAMS